MLEKSISKNNENNFNAAIYGTLAILSGLIAPVFLLFIIKYTGYSEVIEEIAKAAVVFFIILKLPNLKTRLLGAFIFGFLFGLSENVFYLSNFLDFNGFQVFLQRFLWTVPMHIATVLIILLFASIKKEFIILGLFLGIILHLLFNQIILTI